MPTVPDHAAKLADLTRQAEADRSLLRGISSGREDEFSLLYDAYAPVLFALAVKMLRSASDAEEILQELFQDVWRNAVAAPEGTVQSWMVLNARDRALSRLKARGHRKQHHAFDPNGAVLLPERPFSAGESPARDGITAALRSTGRQEQQVLALAFYEGFTEAEIADIVRRPADVVRSQLSAALSALHQATPWYAPAAAPHEGISSESFASRALMVLGADDARKFEAHLALPCERCLLFLRALTQTAALLPLVLLPVPPSPDLKERILFSIRLSQVAEVDLAVREEGAKPPQSLSPPTEAPAAESGGSSWLMIAGIFLVLLILVGLAAYVNTLIDKVSGQYVYIQGQEGELSALKTELSGKRGIFAILDSPRLELIRLKGLRPSPESSGNLFWDAESNRAVLQVSQLPEPADDTEYRLWIVLKDKSILRSGLTPLAGPDSMRTYLAVDRLPAEFHDRVDFVAVVRVIAGAGADATGEMYLQGAAGAAGPDQRMK